MSPELGVQRSRRLTKGFRGKIFAMLISLAIFIYIEMFAIMRGIAGTNMAGSSLTMMNNTIWYAAQMPINWASYNAMSARLASIYLEALAIAVGGPARHLDQVLA